MALPGSGVIGISNLQSEFVPTGSTGNAFSDFYRGGNFVLNGPAANNSIPTSGTISLSNFYGAIQGFNLGDAVNLYDVALCYSQGSRAGSNGVSTPDSIYNYLYWNPLGYVDPSNGRQSQAGTLSSGTKYGYIVLTSGERTGTRNFYAGGTITSRAYNSGQGESTMGACTWTAIKNNSGFPAYTIFSHQGTVTAAFSTITASQGSSNGQLIAKNTQGTSDAGKGGGVVYFYPYNVMKKGFENMDISWNDGA
jgi:hypothetical protein